MILSEYSYDLPKSLIAQSPAQPRDSAKLFIYNTKTNEVFISTFAHIADFLPKKSLIVLNDTKVVPARLNLNRPDGVAGILLSINLWDRSSIVFGIANKKLKVGEILKTNEGSVFGSVISDNNHEFGFKLDFSPDKLLSFLDKYGEAPIPPYIKETGMTEKDVRERYQTIFSVNPASAAAPTASLHFTDKVFESLKQKEIKTTKLTLHVGLGTFAHVTEDNLKSNRLHEELFSVPNNTAKNIFNAKKEVNPVVAVGTTALRALESAKDLILRGEGIENSKTSIFIRKPYNFSVPDILITNFHVPRSSLMCLVDAFLAYKGAKRGIIDLYKIAIEEKFRFYSFGDAMLIL